MVKYFLYGILIYGVMFIARFVLSWSLYKIKGKKFQTIFDFYYFMVGLVGYGLFFATVLTLMENFMEMKSLQVVLGVLLLSLLVSYIHIIAPIKHLFNMGKTTSFDSSSFPDDFIKSYTIKVVDKNITNAFSTGIIPFSKTILLGKPLVEKLGSNTVYSIILHEVGHLRKNHLTKLYYVNLIIGVITYFSLHFIVSLTSDVDNSVLEPVLVGLAGGIAGLLLWYVPGKIQYHLEYEADAFAAQVGGPERMIKALKKLDQISDGKITKGGISHPNIQKRLQNIKRQCVGS